MSWIVNDEKGKEARNYYSGLANGNTNSVVSLRETAQKFPDFKFIQVIDTSDIPSKNYTLVKTITKLKPATLYDVQFHEDLNINENENENINTATDNTTENKNISTPIQSATDTKTDAKNVQLVHSSCLIQTSESKPSPPTNLKVSLKTFSTATVQFSKPEHPNGKIMKYIIVYRRKNSRRSLQRGILDVSTHKHSDLELTMSGLFKNRLYEVQIAVQNYYFTSDYSEWVEFRVQLRRFKVDIPLLSHNWTPILLEQDDIYTNSYKTSVSSIFEQMFVKGVFSPSSVEVQSFSRRFDNTTVARAHVFVSESTVARMVQLENNHEEARQIGLSNEFLKELFELNKFRNPEMEKVREIEVENGVKCFTKDSDCDPSAECFEKVGKIECKCRNNFIDRSVTQFLLQGRFCDTTRKVEGFSVEPFSQSGIHVQWKEPSRILGMPVEYLIRVMKTGEKLRKDNSLAVDGVNSDGVQRDLYFKEISISVNESLTFEHRINGLPKYESFHVEILCVSEITPDIGVSTSSSLKYHHGLKSTE